MTFLSSCTTQSSLSRASPQLGDAHRWKLSPLPLNDVSRICKQMSCSGGSFSWLHIGTWIQLESLPWPVVSSRKTPSSYIIITRGCTSCSVLLSLRFYPLCSLGLPHRLIPFVSVISIILVNIFTCHRRFKGFIYNACCFLWNWGQQSVGRSSIGVLFIIINTLFLPTSLGICKLKYIKQLADPANSIPPNNQWTGKLHHSKFKNGCTDFSHIWFVIIA